MLLYEKFDKFSNCGNIQFTHEYLSNQIVKGNFLIKSPHTARTPPPGNDNEQGFSLIELIIAVGVLAIALTGLVSAITRSYQIDETFENRSVALQGAQSMMSQIKSQKRGQGGGFIKAFLDNTLDSNDRFDVEGLEPGNTTEGRVIYTGPLNNGVDDDGDGTTDESDESDDLGFATVDIRVEWEDMMGEQSVSISSRVYIFDK